MPVKITAKTEKAKAKLKILKEGLTPEKIDPVVEEAARQTQSGLVIATPKKWFGQARAGWVTPGSVIKPAPGARIVRWNAPPGITSPLMLWLEEGTADHGPVVAKRLFIPLTRRAALWFAAAGGYTVAQHAQFRTKYKRTIFSPKEASVSVEYDTIDESGNLVTRRRRVKRSAIEVRGSKLDRNTGQTSAIGRTLVYGVDYILAKRVKGISARRIVENFRPKSRAILKSLVLLYVKNLIKK